MCRREPGLRRFSTRAHADAWPSFVVSAITRLRRYELTLSNQDQKPSPLG